VLRSRRYSRHIARIWRVEAYTGIWREKPRERDKFGDLALDGRIILRWIFMNGEMEVWNVLICLRIGTAVGHL
jgi:hypothetical protein